MIIFTSSAFGKLQGSRNSDLSLQSPWMSYQRASKIFGTFSPSTETPKHSTSNIATFVKQYPEGKDASLALFV